MFTSHVVSHGVTVIIVFDTIFHYGTTSSSQIYGSKSFRSISLETSCQQVALSSMLDSSSNKSWIANAKISDLCRAVSCASLANKNAAITSRTCFWFPLHKSILPVSLNRKPCLLTPSGMDLR